MTININGYEVKITAKRENEKRATSESTMNVLNYLAIQFDEASRYYEAAGAPALARKSRREGQNIYKYLEEKGYYDDIPF